MIQFCTESLSSFSRLAWTCHSWYVSDYTEGKIVLSLCSIILGYFVTLGVLKKEGIFVVVVVCYLHPRIQRVQTHDPERKQTEELLP